MNILAIDTATEILSASLKTDKGQWYTEIAAGLRHSELIIEMCENIAKMADISRKDIDLVACMRGPGSFTGLRIGFSAVKGIALALGIPFISIPTLDCMAYPYQSLPFYILPVIDAKKQCFFTALYHNDELVHDYIDAEIGEILSFLPNDKPIFVCGPASELFAALYTKLSAEENPASSINLVFDTKKSEGYAKCLLEKAEKRYIMDPMLGDAPDSAPLYLRKSDAELNIPKQPM